MAGNRTFNLSLEMRLDELTDDTGFLRAVEMHKEGGLNYTEAVTFVEKVREGLEERLYPRQRIEAQKSVV